MLTIPSPRGRLCDSTTRREWLTVGGLSLVGLSLADFLRGRATASETASAGLGFGKAESVVLVYLQGSPSHIDLWDPKRMLLPRFEGNSSRSQRGPQDWCLVKFCRSSPTSRTISPSCDRLELTRKGCEIMVQRSTC